jgi:hypothetical protein
MVRTLLDERFGAAGRQTWNVEPAEIQRDIDRFLAQDNLQRFHHGFRLGGGTSAQALVDALGPNELERMEDPAAA